MIPPLQSASIDIAAGTGSAGSSAVQPGAAAPGAAAPGAAAPAPAAASATGEAVTVSADAAATTQLLDAARGADGVDQKAVQQLRSAIQAGTYHVAPGALAKAISGALRESPT
jgi:negative regulator of flagellin synthesis FlgM